MITSVIFDIDGTLVDSVDLHARAWQETFQHFGYEFPFDEIRHQIGKGSDKLVPHFISKQEVERIGEELDKFRGELWKTKYFDDVKPIPKVRDLFQRILADGKKIALASSAKGEDLKKYKKIPAIDDLVDKETSSDDVENSKPDPDIVHAASQKLHNPDPMQVVMIGDTPYDAEAARKAGVQVIGVLCGGFPKQELIESGAAQIFRDPAHILANYDESLLGKKAQAA